MIRLSLQATVWLAAWFVFFLAAQPAAAHDQITAESRQTFVVRTVDLHARLATTPAGAAAGPLPSSPDETARAVRAGLHLSLGLLVDEIRGLLNEDIRSHGRTQGLETMLLIRQLAQSPEPLRRNEASGLYAAAVHHFRQALSLGLPPSLTAQARYRLVRALFYDSFTTDPLSTDRVSASDALELLQHGRALLQGGHPEVDAEDVLFVLGVGYLRAARLQVLPSAQAREQVLQLLQTLRRQHPQSLKLMTLEVLADGR